MCAEVLLADGRAQDDSLMTLRALRGMVKAEEGSLGIAEEEGPQGCGGFTSTLRGASVARRAHAKQRTPEPVDDPVSERVTTGSCGGTPLAQRVKVTLTLEEVQTSEASSTPSAREPRSARSTTNL